MKRKVLSTLLAATMLTGLLAGCGNSQEPAASNNEPTATTPAADTDDTCSRQYGNAGSGGHVG